MEPRRAAATLALVCSVLLLGSCVARRRVITRGKATPNQALLTSDKNALWARVNMEYQSSQTLNATVDMVPALGSVNNGKITEYKDVRAYILYKKPAEIRIIGLYPKNEEEVIRTRLAQTFRYILSQRLIPRADGQGRVAAVEILKSTPRTREYMQNGESEGKTLLDAMRDGKFDGMQDFDSVIKDLIQRKVVTLEDGLAFATNQNNMLLVLKGVTAQDDFLRAEADASAPTRTAAVPRPGSTPMLDMITP